MKHIGDIEVAKVYRTDDYRRFKHLVGNRTVERRRINRIKESIRAVGYVMNPIVVNEKMEVIDGQGRLVVLEELELPVYYVISEGAGIEECIHMNVGQSNWRLIDYIASYADKGNADYKRLHDICTEEREVVISPEICAGVAKNQITNGGGITKQITSGEFKLSEENAKETRSALDFIEEHYRGIDGIVGSKRIKITALCWALRNTSIDWKRLGMILDDRYPLFDPVADAAWVNFLANLSDIYNKNLKDPRRCVYLSEAYKRFLREEV